MHEQGEHYAFEMHPQMRAGRRNANSASALPCTSNSRSRVPLPSIDTERTSNRVSIISNSPEKMLPQFTLNLEQVK